MSKNFETQENLRTFFSKKSVQVPILENWLACIKNKKNHNEFDKSKFEKWRAICASVSGVGSVLAWVTCYREWHMWRGQRASMGVVGGVLAWVTWVMCQRRQRTKVSSFGDIAGNTRVIDSIVGGALFPKPFPKSHRK